MTSSLWFLVASFFLCFANAKIGYFWQISDIHYDLKYEKHGDIKRDCWRNELSGGRGRHMAGLYGHFDCDSPWSLVISAVMSMKAKHGDDIEFIIWTGDGLSKHIVGQSIDVEALQNLTQLLRFTFKSQFIFPVLGHDDPGARTNEKQALAKVANLWSHWLPSEALQTFYKGGYYTIEQKKHKLRIVALNTNLYTTTRHQRNSHDDDPAGQWNWLKTVLATSQLKKETVYIMGHMGPGVDERHPQDSPGFSERHTRRYLELVRKYSDIIVGQFFGHLHSDTFRIVYNETGHPVSWMMMAPSVSPRVPSGGNNNPGIRLYKFDTDTGQVLDYTQYYLDLANANERGQADWVPEYNLTSYYQLREVSTSSLHSLAERLKDSSSVEFNRYYSANSVQYKRGSCEEECAHTHYCAVTCLVYQDFSQCMEMAARSRALASGAPFSPRKILLLPLVAVFLFTLMPSHLCPRPPSFTL
nr:PREDICTED: acid sphingomyelinase-like phosphodiesterase 3b [Bemisia tabaci]XP_018905002.1 PREDICTED: acid sphingomyelinase-like phosphodiesterase 3b [Bemisia tabaci]XP_018905003.1 PREDICTED: acid sphingomyelinase-like phosphodiesterase 3b [Bemisia tabaci]XP_018905004.1 PREDICTED: acid sphingomyelinase-like phosphodiesterase 3b [Bemisia tabaci]XP_018905005.1 PREDICTED: acid sphingomyelinase-like phosphodiesterase 3b [Bemisia tabaci]